MLIDDKGRRSTMFEVKHSPINGRGLFAARDIRKGKVVVSWENTREISAEEYKILSFED